MQSAFPIMGHAEGKSRQEGITEVKRKDTQPNNRTFEKTFVQTFRVSDFALWLI